jgi:hypothetical protein
MRRSDEAESDRIATLVLEIDDNKKEETQRVTSDMN